MRSEEYLLLAEIEYWQEVIATRKRILSKRAIDEMVRSQVQAKRKLISLREPPYPCNGSSPEAMPVFVS